MIVRCLQCGQQTSLTLIHELREARAEIARHHRDFERWEAMAAKGAEQLRRSECLEAALRQAREDLENWGAYVPHWAQEKHGLADDLRAIDEALEVSA